MVREARWHLAGYGLIAALSVATRSWLALEIWLLPMVAMKPVHQLQNTIEHLGLPHIDTITQNTRSTRTNALMGWMGWNMQYHTAHHAFPGVPCYRVLSRLPIGGVPRVLERTHGSGLSRRCDVDQRRC